MVVDWLPLRELAALAQTDRKLNQRLFDRLRERVLRQPWTHVMPCETNYHEWAEYTGPQQLQQLAECSGGALCSMSSLQGALPDRGFYWNVLYQYVLEQHRQGLWAPECHRLECWMAMPQS